MRKETRNALSIPRTRWELIERVRTFGGVRIVLLKGFIRGIVICWLFVIGVAVILAEKPSVPVLPQIPSGKTTQPGLDRKNPTFKEGYVRDQESAAQIAEVILFRLYGKKSVISQRPYSVEMDDKYAWWVIGASNREEKPFRVAISKCTAAILFLTNRTPPNLVNGYVPDKKTAIQIAEVVLFQLLGKESVIADRPYHVVQADGIWWIWGTNHYELGGTFRIAISRQSAAVLLLEVTF